MSTHVYSLPNKWFISFDPEHPADFEVYITEDGQPDGKRKLFRVRMHNGPPYPQPVLEEMDIRPDGTVGAIEPLVAVTPTGIYVAIKRNPRLVQSEPVVEAWRKSWSNPTEAPALTSNGGEVTSYTDIELGRGYANTARSLGQIGYRLTVVKAESLPNLSEGEWMDLKKFMRESFDQMGKAVIGTAKVLGYI